MADPNANVSVRCMGCKTNYSTSRKAFDNRTCRCPNCGESKAQLREAA